ncbi:hypothetical protein ACMAZA_01915 [Pseudothioglobus sp. nBUS_23]|uniref:hypothetical protein n=1 Tax=Pseudothioglobus sp. nBUS_23 TaxID=3395318 RepID=UPI003EBC49C8
MSNISFIEYDGLNKKNSLILEKFLSENDFELNTLLISPIWISKLITKYNISCQLIIFYEKDEVIAFHIRLNEFRGYIRVRNYPFLMRSLLTPILKLFFSYSMWRYSLITKQNISSENLQYINNCLEISINRIRHVKFSPIYDTQNTNFDNKEISKWATYIVNLRSKTYFDINTLFSRSLKRSLKKIRNNTSITCERLDFSDKKTVKNFVNWVQIIQKNTGKKIKYDAEILIQDQKDFSDKKFIYEIFLVKLNLDTILGSMVIYGDRNYVNEAELNISLDAKKMNIICQDLIRDEVIKFCIKNGVSFYDLSGFNPNKNRSKKEEGIRFGKAKFNANEFHYSILNR